MPSCFIIIIHLYNHNWPCWWCLIAFLSSHTSTTLKHLLGMTSIFVFSFVMKWCIPQIMILFFSEFLDFYKYFISTILWIRLKPKQTVCIPKHLLKDGWMFLPHWATCWCRRPSVGQTISVVGVSPHVLTTRHQLAAIALISPSKAWENVV